MFVHDPLYRWMLSPLQAIRRQRQAAIEDQQAQAEGGADARIPAGAAPRDEMEAAGGEGGASGMREAAERILTRIKQKLQGYEDPNDSALGVEGQVRLLIASATSEENLHRIFVGWAPWL